MCLHPWSPSKSLITPCVGLLAPTVGRLARDLSPIALMSSLHTFMHLPAHGRNEGENIGHKTVSTRHFVALIYQPNTHMYMDIGICIFLWLPKVESKKFGGMPSFLLLAHVLIQPVSFTKRLLCARHCVKHWG